MLQLSQEVFTFSAPTYPGSVRDSVYRACRSVELWLNGQTPPKHICVVGDGPVGYSIADWCLHKGHSVTLVSKNRPASAVPAHGTERLDDCVTRTICPTTFDFPASHWQTHRYPIGTGSKSGAWSDIAWSRNSASNVMRAIRSNFQLRWRSNKRLTQLTIDHLSSLYHKRVTTSLPGSPGSITVVHQLTVEVETRTGTQQIPCDFVFLATGPGSAKCNIGGHAYTYHGWWSNTDHMLNVPSAFKKQRILIAGGADGGLGNFGRLLSGIADPADLFDQALPSATHRNMLLGLHKRWNASLVSGEPNPDKHRVQQRYHLLVSRVADMIWQSAGYQPIFDLLDNNQNRPYVQLVFPCNHFDNSFLGNRIVAELLARAIASRQSGDPQYNGGLKPFILGAGIAGINPIGHTCWLSKECTENGHEVKLRQQRCSWCPGANPDFLPAMCRRRTKASWRNTFITHTEFAQLNAPRVYDRVVLCFGPDPAKISFPARLAVKTFKSIEDAANPPKSSPLIAPTPYTA